MKAYFWHHFTSKAVFWSPNSSSNGPITHSSLVPSVVLSYSLIRLVIPSLLYVETHGILIAYPFELSKVRPLHVDVPQSEQELTDFLLFTEHWAFPSFFLL